MEDEEILHGFSRLERKARRSGCAYNLVGDDLIRIGNLLFLLTLWLLESEVFKYRSNRVERWVRDWALGVAAARRSSGYGQWRSGHISLLHTYRGFAESLKLSAKKVLLSANPLPRVALRKDLSAHLLSAKRLLPRAIYRALGKGKGFAESHIQHSANKSSRYAAGGLTATLPRPA
jgi:hypothetical protein